MRLTPRNKCLQRLCIAVLLASHAVRQRLGRPRDAADSAQAKAKLAAVRARIAELANRMGSQLAQRDTLSARVRETELIIAAKRQRVEELHAAQLAAERHRAELRAEQTRKQSALQSERASLANQARAAYMMGRQEELKLLLNQSDPATLGRTLTYYGYLAEQRSRKIKVIEDDRRSGCSIWSRRSSSKPRNCKCSRTAPPRKSQGLQHARAERSRRGRGAHAKSWRAATRNSQT